jgi:hypothetical protein
MAKKSTIDNSQPRFAIVNTADAPQRRMVCEWIPDIGYCYMMRQQEPHLKDFDGMRPARPTPIESFGFAVEIAGDEAIFTRTNDSSATYEDGKLRPWQDRYWKSQFSLPLVRGVKRKRVA